MTMLEAALDYVQQGFAVFPVGKDKKPLTKHGLKDATRLQIGVRDYWNTNPEAGIGLVTDGLVVVDFDVKNNGLEGKAMIESEYGEFPQTRAHRTGGGGLHLIYRNPNGSNIRNTAGLGGYPGVDLKANGGYIVVPPSLHESGHRYEVIDDCAITPCPEWLMVLASNSSSLSLSWGVGGSYVGGGRGGEQPIPEGQRNATLASLAGSMRRKGMSQPAIEAALLETNRLQCQPPLPEVDVRRIASSISRYPPEQQNTDKTDNLGTTADLTDKQGKTLTRLTKTDPTDKFFKAPPGRIIWRFVDEWLLDHRGEKFDLDTICRHLDIKNREDRHHVVKKLSYEVDHQKLEKVSGSLYRYIDNTYKSIDWLNVSPSPPLNIQWPYGVNDKTYFGFDGYVTISPGDIIVIAGVSNMGKTAMCLNLLWNNMDAYPCVLMGNEYEAGKFARRVSRMTWADPVAPDGKPKFDLIERYENWKDIIRPDSINIIDWINLSDNFYQIGSILEGIKSKLNEGIAVISLQKSPGKELGLGGGFSQHIASLYLAIDYNRLTVVKAKEWEDVNPNGKMYGFEIEDNGSKFCHIREVQKCRQCSGTGKYRMGDCEHCQGGGYTDL